MNTDELTILDCTLRDGGYYTKWDFEPDLVQRYINAVAAAGIGCVEIGLRSFAREGFLGPFAYSTDSYLENFVFPECLCVAVMVDAKTILNSGRDVDAAVHSLFTHKDQSKISLVRVAAHFSEVQRCGPIVQELRSLGYRVGVNLMQAGGKPDEEIRDKVRSLISGKLMPEVIYFADSLGNMDALEVERIYSAIRGVWSGPIGIHTHNNKGLAVQNSLAAISMGVSWVDATILGMGRGAGNAEMESLITELGGLAGGDPEPLYLLAMEDFQELRSIHNWGPSLLYYFSAIHGIHPSYAQELLSEDRYLSGEKIQIMEHLAQISANNFDSNVFGSALAHRFSHESGDGEWIANSVFTGRSVLVIAAGESSMRYCSDILAFAERINAVVLTVNTIQHIPAGSFHGIVSIDQKRIRFESTRLRGTSTPVFAPIGSLPQDCVEALQDIEVKDYGVQISPGQFEIRDSGCTLPHPLSALYAIALGFAADAQKIYLAGFDGYAAGDPRQTDMVESLELMRSSIPIEDRLVSITSTTYPIRTVSLYAL